MPPDTCPADQLDALVARLRTFTPTPSSLPPLYSVTRIKQLLIARYLGTCSEQARAWLIALWQVLRPELYGRPACRPRIWHT